ncbi:MAG: hypothetical protein A2826_00750 [Candidatus Doudnabacteria bacterium RIFCSPHIGHO2_01_FULL_43_23]|uniref:Uncharacterized protein n=1 Tax=Candidatus Doudnabacteria bacterium RIFCSPHIGHO2_01_FULL_43_23 TaxID=1817822 RepID=A0A1F5NT79_9BACT|nr:MAG: hypothetical protein A2826_00750 [Candidatus Doudnabacteria bacterium RIFCSPHIGHO2_01_FULL_43_23]
MAQNHQLNNGETVFLTMRIKIFVAFLIVSAILVAGYFLYFKDNQNDNSVGDSNTETPELLPESWLVKYFGISNQDDPSVGGVEGDPDGDLLINLQEYSRGTNPLLADSDGDGNTDGMEVAYGTDPLILDGQEGNFEDVESVIKEMGDNLVSTNLIDAQEINGVLRMDEPLVLPQISDSEIKIVSATPESFQTYVTRLTPVLEQYTSGEFDTRFYDLFNATGEAGLAPFRSMVDGIVAELKAVPVPSDRVESHKVLLVFFQTTRDVIGLQEQIIAEPENNSLWGDVFYNARILMTMVETVDGIVGS